MRWLLVKDLQILRRSPLLVALLVLYPIAISLLIGVALSRGPERPRVAIVNLVPREQGAIQVGGQTLDATAYARRLFTSVEPVTMSTRAAAVRAVRDGDVLGALVIPADVGQRLQATVSLGATGAPPRVEVITNTSGPLDGELTSSLIDARLAEANEALSSAVTRVAGGYLGILLNGGTISLLGRDFDVLGLRRTEAAVGRAIAALPAGSAQRAELERVRAFARQAIDELGTSGQVLGSIASPLRVRRTDLSGAKTPLDAFAVAVSVTISVMVVCLLLGAGMLALEREEHAFGRLVRGLVSRHGLVVEKIVLAALCSVVVGGIMLGVVATFVDLDWARAPLWLAALGAGALAFGALGVALGALAREVRAASLAGIALALPLAFAALVPSGTVASGVHGTTSALSAAFPFKPTLDALQAALNDTGSIGGPLAHLAGLTVAFGVLGRVALRRFA
jgi:ABC-2 family transporter protein